MVEAEIAGAIASETDWLHLLMFHPMPRPFGRGIFVWVMYHLCHMDGLSREQIILLNQWMGQTRPVMLGELARLAGMSALQCRQHLDVLARAGCRWQTHPQEGLSLEKIGLGCWADYLETRHPEGLGRKVRVYEQTASTQTVAKTLVASGDAASGMVVLADHQTEGQGRLGRRWYASPGQAVLLTAMVQSDHGVGRLTLGAALGAADAIAKACGLETQVRWPNDLYLQGKKVAGMLVEKIGPWALIGMGINTHVETAKLPVVDAGRKLVPTSLLEQGAHVWRLHLVDLLLSALDHCLFEMSDADLVETWRRRCDQLQQTVVAHHDGRAISGRVIDLDPAQGLVLQVEGAAVVTLPPESTTLEPADGL